MQLKLEGKQKILGFNFRHLGVNFAFTARLFSFWMSETSLPEKIKNHPNELFRGKNAFIKSNIRAGKWLINPVWMTSFLKINLSFKFYSLTPSCLDSKTPCWNVSFIRGDYSREKGLIICNGKSALLFAGDCVLQGNFLRKKCFLPLRHRYVWADS